MLKRYRLRASLGPIESGKSRSDLLSDIIHDWDENQCLTMLGHCRKAIQSDGRLLIIEMVLPAVTRRTRARYWTSWMLVMPGGQERTEAKYWARPAFHRRGAHAVSRECSGSCSGLSRGTQNPTLRVVPFLCVWLDLQPTRRIGFKGEFR
jgi:hypothetical protein